MVYRGEIWRYFSLPSLYILGELLHYPVGFSPTHPATQSAVLGKGALFSPYHLREKQPFAASLGGNQDPSKRASSGRVSQSIGENAQAWNEDRGKD